MLLNSGAQPPCCITLIIINTTNQAQQCETAFLTASELTLLSCMSRLAPFFKSTSVASTLLTAAAQWRADFPREKEQRHVATRAVIKNKDAKTSFYKINIFNTISCPQWLELKSTSDTALAPSGSRGGYTIRGEGRIHPWRSRSKACLEFPVWLTVDLYKDAYRGHLQH